MANPSAVGETPNQLRLYSLQLLFFSSNAKKGEMVPRQVTNCKATKVYRLVQTAADRHTPITLQNNIRICAPVHGPRPKRLMALPVCRAANYLAILF